jgi:hypothetical protein
MRAREVELPKGHDNNQNSIQTNQQAFVNASINKQFKPINKRSSTLQYTSKQFNQ